MPFIIVFHKGVARRTQLANGTDVPNILAVPVGTPHLEVLGGEEGSE